MSFVTGLLSILGVAGQQILMRLIGYKFISKSAISAMKAWSKTTVTYLDDEVTIAAAEALDVPIEDFRQFLIQKQKKDGL